MNKKTSKSVDRESVRLLAIEIGAREAARRLGIKERPFYPGRIALNGSCRGAKLAARLLFLKEAPVTFCWITSGVEGSRARTFIGLQPEQLKDWSGLCEHRTRLISLQHVYEIRPC